ncbi:MAG: UDP-N-acetylglucosamine 1-carboxyvinyltransferase [Culicoidibacterales bacterium]
MKKEIKISGGVKLAGDVYVNGAKNAALPILAATLLFEEAEITLQEIPQIKDVCSLCQVLEACGVSVRVTNHEVKIIVPKKTGIKNDIPEEISAKMRASLLVLGPLLATKGEVKISAPGGCSIGYRPIDLHIGALELMGATIEIIHGNIVAKAVNGLKAATINLDYPSVGATENIIMAAVLTNGKTKIQNAATEPEILDLIRFLNQSGAKISGAGTTEIEIEGVSSLCKQIAYEIIPDRIEAATYMIAAAVTGGKIRVHNIIGAHLISFIAKLREIGVKIEYIDDTLEVTGKCRYDVEKSIDIKTAPYPGFQTDMQVLMIPLLLKINRSSMIVDTIFDQRFRHVQEFINLGANMTQVDNMLIIDPKDAIKSGAVTATDVRAAAALVLLGLSGDTEISIKNIHHLFRGYESLLDTLISCGAKIIY